MAIHNVAVVEDHLLQRRYLVALINSQSDMRVVFDGEELPELTAWLASAASTSHPHLIVLDLMVERRPSAKPETVRRLVSAGHRVIMFSAVASPPLARQMVRAGVHGLISKRDGEAKVLAALRTVLSGDRWVSPELAAVIAQDPARPRLSDQEERALVLYASGVSIDDVAASLGVRPHTARKYLQRVRDKYAAVERPLTSRLAWNRTAIEDGYLPAGS